MGKKIFKQLLPLLIAFIAAVLFFLGYNNYLLDSSVANLKISLKELAKSKDLGDIKEVTALLNDSFLSEIAKGDFDLAFAIKMEISGQLAEQTEAQETKSYMVRLSSATNIDFSTIVAEKISKESQVADIRHFIENAINKKIADQPLLISKLDDFLITIFPGRRKEKTTVLEDEIKKIQKTLANYKGTQLQEKYVEMGKIYLLMKEWKNAQNSFEQALQVDAKNEVGIKSQFFLGILFKAKKDFKQASTTFGNIKNSLPKQWRYFAMYQEADCLYRVGETEKAIALFEELYKENPSLEIPQLAQFRAAYTYLHDLKEPLKAHEAFAVLEKEEPIVELSSYIVHKINPDIAWQYCIEGLRLLEEGYNSSLSSKYEESLDKFDLALKIVPNHSTTFIGKALAFYFLDRSEDAINEGVKAKEVDPTNATVIANLGFLYANLGMLDNAVDQYKEAIKIYPLSVIYNYNLATVYALKNDYNKAEFYFKEAIKLNSRYPYAYNNLGYSSWRQGKHREAKENFKKAIALKPDYIEPHYNLGIVHYLLGNYEEARKEFTIVQKLKASFRQTHWYLEQVNNALGYK